DHFGPQVAGKQRQDILAPDLGAQRERFLRKQSVEGLDVHLGAFELRPGILEMVDGVGASNDIGGQAAFGLETGECLKGRGRQHAAEIPDHCFKHCFIQHPDKTGKPLTWRAASRQSSGDPGLRQTRRLSEMRGGSFAPRSDIYWLATFWISASAKPAG